MIPKCQVVPLADQVFSFEVDGKTLLHWNAAHRYPRPFFFPVYGPGQSLMTRMGHPGAPDHDHHNSIWFAHHKVLGMDFWSNTAATYIKQLGWLVIEDGPEQAVLAVQLAWFDGHDPQSLLEQELIIGVNPDKENQDYSIELQSRFVPTSATLEFQKTNFGFLAVRVAKSISAIFGGGVLTNSHGKQGESDIFGKPADWVDYSGPVRTSTGQVETAGITMINHPQNPNSPISWHVRDDGWMGASACGNSPLQTHRDQPLMLRYLLHVHQGKVDPQTVSQRTETWQKKPAYSVTQSKRRGQQLELRRD